ncbi:MAG: excinuclease ABC subunit UvrA [Sandaracinaceae bacterium]
MSHDAGEPRQLVVRGARTHNLKDVDVSLPRERLVVVTGPSGSGKSSLAFDTIYAEGQRRYVESLSVHAQRAVERLPRPDVDLIEGLSPAIAVRQRASSAHPRSTVGTTTEIHDYLRLLMARVGRASCPVCGRPVRAYTIPQMVGAVLALGEGARVIVRAPLGRLSATDLAARVEELAKAGYTRVAIDGAPHEVGEPLPTVAEAELEVQIDRLVVRAEQRERLADSIELATGLSGGRVRVARPDGEPLEMSEQLACEEHGLVLERLEPQTFSWNSPLGACPECAGLGEVHTFDADAIVPDPTRSIREGAIAPWGPPGGAYHRARERELTASVKVDLDKPWRKIGAQARRAILEGRGDWIGVIPLLERRERAFAQPGSEEDEASIAELEAELARFRRSRVCPLCGGARLRPEALAVRLDGRSIHEIATLPIETALAFFDGLSLDGADAEIAAPLVREIGGRLRFLVDVGLGYLTLARRAATLSGGEAQRIRLATQLGAALVGVLYVLDEPTVGLHPRDTERLLATLTRLRDRGNTVLVVEHDPAVWRAADHLVDMGPGAGRLGGEVVDSGTPSELAARALSATGRTLATARGVEPRVPRTPRGWLALSGARAHNLADVSTRFPLGALSCVSGVSGSGKSSLVMDTLLPLARAAVGGRADLDVQGTLSGAGALDKVIAIDQAPIGRSPRSTPITYAGLFDGIRELFASLPDARTRGYTASRFSFNTKGGRCEACKGDGVVRVPMGFLPDVYVRCDECEGRRYDPSTLAIRFRGLSIADFLELTIDEALAQLEAIPKLNAGLTVLSAVGLGYLTLGQSATTLSGGEAQRLKLGKELAQRATGSTLYVLDEPTTGLYTTDVQVLLRALDDLVDRGNTVIVVEHDLELLAAADHVIELGPEGGAEGGRVVFEGTPAELRKADTATARYLRDG